MISRVADHCFWFGRYLERTESTARLVQVTASLALDSELTPQQCWQPVVITAGEQERFTQLCGPFAAADGDAVQRYLTLDERVPVSLRRSVAAARENARSSRDVISLEAWEIVNELYLYLESATAREDFEDHPYGFYRRVRREAQLCLGFCARPCCTTRPSTSVGSASCSSASARRRASSTCSTRVPRRGERRPGRVSDRRGVALALPASRLLRVRAVHEDPPGHRLRAVGCRLPHLRAEVSPRRSPWAAACARPPPRGPARRARSAGSASVRAHRGAGSVDRRQHATPLDAKAVHEILTRVVDETHAVCDLVQSELIAAEPQSQSQSQGQTQMQSQSSSNGGA